MSDPEQSATSALAEFWIFAKDFKSLSSWVAKAAVSAPLADLVLNMGPPWPSRLSVALILCIAEIVVLMFSFEFWRRGSPRIHNIRKVMKIGLCALVILFVVYIFMFSTYIVDAFSPWNRVVIGYKLHDDIADLVASEPSKWTTQKLLKQFHEEKAIWTGESVNFMRSAILILWVALWVAISVVMAAFVSLQWRRL